MVEAQACRDIGIVWMRRLAFCFVGVTSATGTLVLALATVLLISGVLQW